MPGMIRAGMLVLSGFVMAASGCNGSGSAERVTGQEAKSAPTTAARQQRGDDQRAVAASDRRPPGPSYDSPEATVRSVLDGLRNNRPRVLWEALPASYQRDVNDLVHGFADRMDEEVWERAFATASRLLDVLRAKKSFAVPWIAQLPPVRAAGPTNERDLSAAYDQMLQMLSSVVESDIARLDQLRSLNIGDYLDGTGTRLMEQISEWSRLSPDDPFQTEFKQWLADVKVKPLSQQGDKAVLRITATDALGEPLEREWSFVRIENRWVPQDWAANWDQRLGGARGSLERFASETLAQNKPVALQRLDQINAVLDELEGAKTAGEFQVLMAEKVVAPVMLALRSTKATKAPPPETSSDGRTAVSVVVHGALNPAAQEELQLKLSEAGDAIVGVPRVEDGSVRFDVTPVRDVAEYAGRLDFLRVLRIDRRTRTITAERAE